MVSAALNVRGLTQTAVIATSSIPLQLLRIALSSIVWLFKGSWKTSSSSIYRRRTFDIDFVLDNRRIKIAGLIHASSSSTSLMNVIQAYRLQQRGGGLIIDGDLMISIGLLWGV